MVALWRVEVILRDTGEERARAKALLLRLEVVVVVVLYLYSQCNTSTSQKYYAASTLEELRS